jgi:hypothetical protein
MCGAAKEGGEEKKRRKPSVSPQHLLCTTVVGHIHKKETRTTTETSKYAARAHPKKADSIAHVLAGAATNNECH